MCGFAGKRGESKKKERKLNDKHARLHTHTYLEKEFARVYRKGKGRKERKKQSARRGGRRKREERLSRATNTVGIRRHKSKKLCIKHSSSCYGYVTAAGQHLPPRRGENLISNYL
jgi:hypothetical protein